MLILFSKCSGADSMEKNCVLRDFAVAISKLGEGDIKKLKATVADRLDKKIKPTSQTMTSLKAARPAVVPRLAAKTA